MSDWRGLGRNLESIIQASSRAKVAGRGAESMLDTLREMREAIEAAPPIPWAIIARYDVPLRTGFRYWDTKGRLVVYVNRSIIDGLKRQQGGVLAVRTPEKISDYWGIPLYFEGPDDPLYLLRSS